MFLWRMVEVNLCQRLNESVSVIEIDDFFLQHDPVSADRNQVSPEEKPEGPKTQR